MDLGPPTAAQIEWTLRDRRISKPSTLGRVGARHVRARFRDRESGEWRVWRPYLALPTLAGGWKLWGPQGDGRLFRANAGAVSIFASPDLRTHRGEPFARLWDVEGESDALTAIDAGMLGVISSTGGASALTGHELHRGWLKALSPAEVVIVRDLDDAGRKGSERAAAWWSELGVRARVLELPAELGQGGDLRDFLRGRRPVAGRVTLPPLGGPAELLALLEAQ